MPLILTPPIRSASFWLLASSRAMLLVAPFSDSANTEEPLAVRLATASAWMEMNRSAPSLRALATRTPSGMNTSSSRVRCAFMFFSLSISFFSWRLMRSTTSFS
ncbi:hypothetical protein D3C72_2075980 [compost metagenome]